eukprot:SM000446S16116  [mRNA]  locus=s446:23472:24461:+ [translate_table: standard]
MKGIPAAAACSLLLLLRCSAGAWAAGCLPASYRQCSFLIAYPGPVAVDFLAAALSTTQEAVRAQNRLSSATLVIPTGSTAYVSANCTCLTDAALLDREYAVFIYNLTGGDTADKIAKQPYAGLTTAEDIKSLNQINDDLPPIGTPLRIPVQCSCKDRSNTTVDLTYPVRANDTVQSISERYNVSVPQLVAGNNITNLTDIQVLIIPVAAVWSYAWRSPSCTTTKYIDESI